MSYRKINFNENESYHIFNRSINRENILINKREIKRFFSLINFYRFKTKISFSQYTSLSIISKKSFDELISTSTPLVEICSFCIMPNHYHFLMKQLAPKGISLFISNIQNGFAKYYNIKNNRYGGLFCGMFKAVKIRTDEQFLHVSRYIHLNPVIANIIDLKELDYYPLTSFSSYMNNHSHSFLSKKIIDENFINISNHKKFIRDQEEYLRKLSELVLI